MSSEGFSLIELLAVMVLLAIFAGLVGISVRGHVDNAKLEALLDRIETLDGRVRDQAQRHQLPDELRIDIERGRMYHVRAGRSPGPAREISLDEAVQIDRVRTGNRSSRHGELRVPISLHGQSDSYALRLQAATGRTVWLVVLGTTGQCLRTEEEKDVVAFLSPL